MSIGPPKYVAVARLWRDKVYGNTYHKVYWVCVDTGEENSSDVTYGYGNHYVQTLEKALGLAYPESAKVVCWLPVAWVSAKRDL